MRAACSRQQPMQHHPRKRNATAKAAEGNLGGFCVSSQKLRVRWIGPLFFCDSGQQSHRAGFFRFCDRTGAFLVPTTRRVGEI
jgi:hypothetical protein